MKTKIVLNQTKKLAIAAVLLGTSLSQNLLAATHTWHGEGFFGNKTLVWSDPFNWAEGAPTAGEANVVLVFPPDTDTYVTNDIAGLVVDQIQISGTNYVLQGVGGGNSLTILGSGPLFADVTITGASNVFASSLSIVLSNTVSFNISTNKMLTINSHLSGTGGIDKAGSGTVRFNGLTDYNYAGTTTVRNGRLELYNRFFFFDGFLTKLAVPGNLIVGNPSLTSPAEVRLLFDHQVANSAMVTVYTNGLFNLWGSDDTIGALNLYGGEADTAGGILTLSGNVTATGDAQLNGYVSLGGTTRTFHTPGATAFYVGAQLDQGGASAGIVKTGSGFMGLGDTNHLDGQISINEGTIVGYHSGAFGTTMAGTVVADGAGVSLWPFVSINGETLFLEGSGPTTDGALGFSTGANWNGPVQLNGPAKVKVFGAADTCSINGAISGPGQLIKIGLGTLRLAGANHNTYSGGADVREGSLQLAKNSGFNAVINQLIIGTNNGAPGSAVAYPSVSSQIQDATAVIINGGGAYSANGFNEAIGSLAGSGIVNLSTTLLTVGVNNTDTTFSGTINGIGPTNLNKSGTGTWTIAGSSPISGKTLVTGGKLAVNGSMANSPMFVYSGATLCGTGTVGSITVDNNGTLAPGTSPGLINVLGSLTMLTGSIYAVEIFGFQAGSTYDQTAVAGSVNLTNATLQASVNVNSAVSNSFTIIQNYSAGAVNGYFDGLPQNSVLVAGKQWRIRYDGGSGNDVVMVQDNTSPQISQITSPATWPEGSPLTLSGTYIEPDAGDTAKVVVSWGDGSTTTNDASGGTFSAMHSYADDNPTGTPQDQYTISAFLFDNNGGVGGPQNRFPTITNVPPTFNVPAGLGVLPDQPIAATLAISDPGTDTFQAYVNYGAGGGAPAVPVNGNLFNLDYTYPSNGTYTVTILVRDDDNGETLNNFDVVVGMKLSIANADSGNVRLSWPSIAQNLFVECATNVVNPAWTVLPESPMLDVNEYFINVPKTNPASFYRLGWDPSAQ